MTNNDILKRLRFTLNISDEEIVHWTSEAGFTIELNQVSAWLSDEETDEYRALQDQAFAAILNGVILLKRGPREDGQVPKIEEKLNNNIIFRKLKIAFELQNDEVLKMLSKVGFNLSKHELSAFFRREGHKHYRELKDQILRNFLNALQQRIRPIQEGSDKNKSKVHPKVDPTNIWNKNFSKGE